MQNEQNSPINVVYSDNHVVVIDKPAGLLTQPSGTDQISAESLAKEWVKEKFNKPGKVFLEAVHRIDKPVSGIVLFAKTSKALSRLQQAMREKKTHKMYLAVVENLFKDPAGALEHYLIHDEFKAKVVSESTPDAKYARLKYKVLKTKGNLSLVEIELETGRYHQIRVQFSAIGHPIVGDTKYGSTTPFGNDEIALNHHRLQVAHPVTGEILVLNSTLPNNWPLSP